ncbi:MAG: pseudouridine-5'-phosphate glycosidase [Anaerolineales bacterium]|nr:pseudouridine-5'-phosphate glycosidase [Anaerolineales bacterium]
MLHLEDVLVKSSEVKRAMRISLPMVALESTVLTHGLPRPQNLQLAHDMERAVREQGATPATIGFLDGYLHIGLTEGELDRLANEREAYKVGPRDFATVITEEACGGTTVAGTMFACKQINIRVFATGGIGGVHRESGFDISADLQALATIPMIVVCAGAKAILDLPATLEYLETMSVPVIGYGTDEFPAFYSRDSGLEVSLRLNTPAEIVEFAKTHWSMGPQSAVLVANPLPAREAIPRSEIEPLIKRVSDEAQEKEIHGKELTPFLLQRLGALTQGKTVQANLSLLRNNARLAAQIAKAIRSSERRRGSEG